MKFKKFMLFSLSLAIVATAIDFTDLRPVKAFDGNNMQSEIDSVDTSTDKAALYRFLQTTREKANEDSCISLSGNSGDNISIDLTRISEEDLDAALNNYISDLNDVAKQNKKQQAEDAKRELLECLSAKETDGVAFASPAKIAAKKEQLTNAMENLGSSMLEAQKTFEKEAKKKEAKKKSAEEQRNTSSKEDSTESILDKEIQENNSLTDADKAEIALCKAAANNVPDGVGNCDSRVRSYMSYTAVTCETSPQYALLRGDTAYTDPKTGIRMVDGRYCIAVGFGYTKKIGTKIDLVMADGAIIRCILGDCKASKDTDSSMRYCKWDGSVAEFIIDNDVFNKNTKRNPVNTALGNYERILKVVIIE